MNGLRVFAILTALVDAGAIAALTYTATTRKVVR